AGIRRLLAIGMQDGQGGIRQAPGQIKLMQISLDGGRAASAKQDNLLVAAIEASAVERGQAQRLLDVLRAITLVLNSCDTSLVGWRGGGWCKERRLFWWAALGGRITR